MIGAKQNGGRAELPRQRKTLEERELSLLNDSPNNPLWEKVRCRIFSVLWEEGRARAQKDLGGKGLRRQRTRQGNEGSLCISYEQKSDLKNALGNRQLHSKDAYLATSLWPASNSPVVLLCNIQNKELLRGGSI